MKTESNEKDLILNTIDAKSQSTVKKTKKTKKKTLKPKEKKCKDLRELLEQINQEKLEKIKKEEENQKNLKIDTTQKDVSQISSGNLTPTENEDKNKDYLVKDYLNIFNNSVSGTTVATLSQEDLNDFQKFNFDKYSNSSNRFEYSDLKPNYLMKTCEISEDEKNVEEEYKFKRKMSSPILDYYNGFDKILSEIHKSSVDLSNSMNFIKKEDFINSGICMNNNNYNNFNELNYYFNPEVNNHKIYINNNNEDNNINFDNIEEENENGELNNNDIDNNNINIYNNKDEFKYMKTNYIYSPYCEYFYLSEMNCNSKFVINKGMNNNKNYNIENKSYQHISRKKCKTRENRKEKNKPKNSVNKNKKDIYPYLSYRKGDWLCHFCLNLNFSFRTFCNRCRAPKQ